MPIHNAIARRLVLAALLLAVCLVPASADAGIRGPGTYEGWLHADPWGGLVLIRGSMVDYIVGEDIEQLRPHAGQHVRLDVKKAEQFINPGDARLSDIELLDPLREDQRDAQLRGLAWNRPQWTVLPYNIPFRLKHSAVVSFRLHNPGEQTFELSRAQVSLIVLRKAGEDLLPMMAHDMSVAVIHRQPLKVGDDLRRHGERERP